MTTLLLIGFWLFLVQNTRIGIASGTVPGAGRCARCGLGRAVRRGGASRPLVACAVRLLLRGAGAHACRAIVDLVLCSSGSGRHAGARACLGLQGGTGAAWSGAEQSCSGRRVEQLWPTRGRADATRCGTEQSGSGRCGAARAGYAT